jgi:hypothetical protein
MLLRVDCGSVFVVEKLVVVHDLFVNFKNKLRRIGGSAELIIIKSY